MTPESTYRICTWDCEKQDFTPQEGVPELVQGIRGLLQAIRLLKNIGYTAHRNRHDNDAAVLIERVE